MSGWRSGHSAAVCCIYHLPGSSLWDGGERRLPRLPGVNFLLLFCGAFNLWLFFQRVFFSPILIRGLRRHNTVVSVEGAAAWMQQKRRRFKAKPVKPTNQSCSAVCSSLTCSHTPVQHVHVVLRDEAADACAAVRSRDSVQKLLLSGRQCRVLLSDTHTHSETHTLYCVVLQNTVATLCTCRNGAAVMALGIFMVPTSFNAVNKQKMQWLCLQRGRVSGTDRGKQYRD